MLKVNNKGTSGSSVSIGNFELVNAGWAGGSQSGALLRKSFH